MGAPLAGDLIAQPQSQLGGGQARPGAGPRVVLGREVELGLGLQDPALGEPQVVGGLQPAQELAPGGQEQPGREVEIGADRARIERLDLGRAEPLAAAALALRPDDQAADVAAEPGLALPAIAAAARSRLIGAIVWTPGPIRTPGAWAGSRGGIAMSPISPIRFEPRAGGVARPAIAAAAMALSMVSVISNALRLRLTPL